MAELGCSIKETAQSLEPFDVRAEYLISFEQDLPRSVIIKLYNVFQRVTEAVFDRAFSLFAALTSDNGQPLMSIRLSGLRSLPAFSIDGLKVQRESEEEWLLSYKSSLKEGAYHEPFQKELWEKLRQRSFGRSALRTLLFLGKRHAHPMQLPYVST